MPEAPFQVRRATDADRFPLAVVFAAIAEERDGIASEPPVAVAKRAAGWTIEWTYVAIGGDEVVGSLHLEPNSFGYGEIGMAVARAGGGRGVG